jgi:CRP/FNR family transcriptional regulator
MPCLQQILQPVHKARYKPQTNLVFPGDHIGQVYLIEKGWVKVYRLNEHGQESICSILGAGDSVMLNMLLYPDPSPVGVKTETECELLSLPIDHMRSMLKSHSEFGMKVVEEISAICHNSMYLIEQITVQPALQRVGSFLLMTMLESKSQPCQQFELPYGKSEIAHYLGLTPETFSRCLKVLGTQGVTSSGRNIQLSSLVSLCQHCDTYTAQKCKRHHEKGFCRLWNCFKGKA